MIDPPSSRRKPEWYLALLAAAVCSVISIRLYALVGTMQPVWPFPAVYLVEVTSLAWVGVYALSRGGGSSAATACVVAGAVAGFTILGVLSIGLYYAPVAVLLGVAAGWAAWRNQLSLAIAIAAFAFAVAAQMVLMLAILRLLPSLTFL